jgi:prepilin-type cleavage/methylation N-terminal domain protein
MSSKLKMAFIMNMGSRLVTKEKTGFTLAEVLITLGIIGVVAALAILKVD